MADPRRFLNKGFKSLADAAPILSQNGEGVEIDSQARTTYDNDIPVYRDLTLSGKINASFTIHGDTTLTLNNAQLSAPENMRAAITLASDFTGYVKIINSAVKTLNKDPNVQAFIVDTGDFTNRPAEILLQNSTVEGIAVAPIRLILEGDVKILSKSATGFSAINASMVSGENAKLSAKYIMLINANRKPAQVHEIDCLAGPVSFGGLWDIQNLTVNSKSYENFKFDSEQANNIPSYFYIHKLVVAKIANGASAFYANRADLNFKQATLGDSKTQAVASINNTNISMQQTTDYLSWQLSGSNGLELDNQSLTKLRTMKGQFRPINSEAPRTMSAASNSNAAPAADEAQTSNATNNDLDNLEDSNEPNQTNATDGPNATQAKQNSNLLNVNPNDAGLAEAQNKTQKVHDREHKEVQKAGGMERLNNLIGLGSVKKTLTGYVNVARTNQEMKRRGLPTDDDMSRHMVFAGNPGTGKTTVAKIVAQILYEEGALRTPNCVSVKTDKLVSDHIGGTAKATEKVVQKALGGVLFIDEAYMLDSTTNDNKFAQEAVDTLMADMENYHNDLIVILAGYEKPMHKFLKNTNPGLTSRFNNWVTFPDYKPQELLQIFNLKLKNKGLKLENPAYEKTKMFNWNMKHYVFDHTDENGRPVSSNGRGVRNYLQALNVARSNRLAKQEFSKLDDNTFVTINAKDIKTVFKQKQAQEAYDKKQAELDKKAKQEQLAKQMQQAGLVPNVPTAPNQNQGGAK